jgi:hypothetical protein
MCGKMRTIGFGEEVARELQTEVDAICAAFAQEWLMAHEHEAGAGAPAPGFLEATESG